jgi:hypothetical protein
MQQVDFHPLHACGSSLLVESFVAMGTDIALLIDRDGLVAQIAQSGKSPMAEAASQWVGRRWVDTVSPGTRSKIERVLDEARSDGMGIRREVNHPGLQGEAHPDLPVSYSAMRTGPLGSVLAVGRDLRNWVSAQRQLVASQQLLESDYWLGRQAGQSRSRLVRLLGLAAGQPAIVICSQTFRLLDANPAAMALLSAGREPGASPVCGSWFGQDARRLFDAQSWPAVQLLIQTARRGHRGVSLPARLAATHHAVRVSAFVPPAEQSARRLLQLGATDGSGPEAAPVHTGVVLSDAAGVILGVNAQMADWLGRRHPEAWTGQALAGMLQDGQGGAARLLQAVGRQGLVQDLGLSLLSDAGDALFVRLSALLVADDDAPVFGFAFGRPGWRGAVRPFTSR